MESDRSRHRLSRVPHRQAGLTLIGFLLLATVFGVLGLAVLRIVPLYLEKMSIDRVLEDVQTELATGGNSAPGIALALENRFYIENIEPLSGDELEISRQGEGFLVSVNRESRAEFVADLYFLVVTNEQVEISR